MTRDPFVEAAKLKALIGDPMPDCPGPFGILWHPSAKPRRAVGIVRCCDECEYRPCKWHPELPAQGAAPATRARARV